MAGRKKVKDQVEQAAALVAMTDQGLSRKDAGRVLGLTKATVDEILDGTALELKARAREYLDIHLAAARVAAEKGRAEPAQWALERAGVVQPQPVAAPSGGTNIMIGIRLPGLAPDAGQVIEVTDVPVLKRSED